MCFKRQVINWEWSPKIALLFAINDYPGTVNDLNCCVNDLDMSLNHHTSLGFQIRAFQNSEAKRKVFIEQIRYAFLNAKFGDYIWIDYSGHGSYRKDTSGDEIDGYDETLCLYDGDVIDDETAELCKLIPVGVTVVFFLDSCFSGSATRIYNPEYRKTRFKPPKREKKLLHKRIKRAVPADFNRIVISACLENESAEEAVIGESCNGVAHFYLWHTYTAGITWNEWFKKIKLYLPNKNFKQTPTLEIAESKLNDIAIP